MNKVITITRQFGSGGREIGKKLAEAYGIPFYDNEIISRAAKDTGFAEAAFEHAEDKASNSLLYSIAMGMNVFSSQDVGFSGLSLDAPMPMARDRAQMPPEFLKPVHQPTCPASSTVSQIAPPRQTAP